MAKDRTSAVVKKELDRLAEKGMTLSISRLDPTTYKFDFNFEIMKYHRQRAGRFGQYDPLHKYKEIVKNLIQESLRDQQIELPETYWTAPFRIKIECFTPPKKGSGSKKSLLYKLLGYIKRSIYPDLDNLAKTPMDIMNQLIWYDDAQAYELTIRKAYSLEETTVITVSFDPEDPTWSTGRLTPEEATRHAELLNLIEDRIWSTTTD